MIKIFILVVAVGLSILFGMYIKSYNENTNFNAQERFKTIMDSAEDQAQAMLKEVDKKKKEAFEIMKDKKDKLLQQQQKELFNQ